ncbi:MAG: hypothetical protein ABIS50_16165 [Luteolibacter sp.]|uniref:hypothetical protein n=1 Tax=Luteolibacter sp. TaxID=1962973 RepID=UPI003264C00D
MSEFNKLLAVSALLSNLALAGPTLDQAEVRLPYGELKSLINGANRPVDNPKPDPALLSARFHLSVIAGKPLLDATFRTATFADGLAKVPLVGGNVTVESQQPQDARVVVQDGMLCQALEKAGAQILEMKLLPVFGADCAVLVVPPSPASIFETGDLGEGWSVAVKIDGREQVLGSNRLVALPLAGGDLEIRMLGGEETREALRPPEPSVWTWQHQALVIPGDGEIVYHVLASASASGGSGVSALLTLPADAREVKATGDDLAGQKLVRGADRSLGLQIDWKTRGLLEREIAVSYQLPLRPLDRSWKLQSPSGPGENSTRTRFIVVGSPELSYAADGLAGPFPPKGLPSRFAEELNGASCYQLEAAASAELTVNPLPVVATAEATITNALWLTKLEPDGAMLVEGEMNLEHRGMLGVILDVPPGMTLLSCNVGGRPVTPGNLGDGKLEISLPAAAQKTGISCSFTGRAAAIDPVEGTLELALPKTPLFIRALAWKVDLPSGYQAETSGNLIRAAEPGDPPSRMTLKKNLCRDERPVTNVFYQRSNLKN